VIAGVVNCATAPTVKGSLLIVALEVIMLVSEAVVEDGIMSVLEEMLVDMTESVDEAEIASEVLLVIAGIKSEEVLSLLMDATENGAIEIFIMAEAAAVDVSPFIVISGTEIWTVASVLMVAVDESVMDVDIIVSVAPGQPLVSVQLITEVELIIVSCMAGGGHPDVKVHPIIAVDSVFIEAIGASDITDEVDPTGISDAIGIPVAIEELAIE